MKKGLVLFLTLALLLGMTSLASAQDKIITPKVVGRAYVGYLYLPDYNNADYRQYSLKPGACYFNFRWFQFRLNTNISLSRDLNLNLSSQFEAMDGKAYPFQNLTLTYDPGFAKVTFAAKGQDVGMGPMEEPLLRLNVARRLTSDGEPNIYKEGGALAKQLTTELLFDWARAVAVFSLESSDDIFADFVGGFVEFELGDGKFGVGYHNKMIDKMYEKPVPEGYYALSADYRFTPNIRLQFDYSSNNNGGEGYEAYWRPLNEIDAYPGTPFKIKNHINTITTVYDAKVALRLLDTTDKQWKYWLDGSYYLQPFTIGVNYRNWSYEQETKADGYVAEFYLKHDLTDSWRDVLKVFYRTDGWCGALIDISLY